MAHFFTLEDFYALFSEHSSKSLTFSAKNENDEIVVLLPARWTFDENTSEATEGLTKVHLQACHTLDNTNQCFIPEASMVAALPSFSNRPILAYIFKDENGEYQFNTHRKYINKNGETVYEEHPVGVIPESCNAHLQYDEEKAKTYVEVDGYIYDEYSKAKEILEREGECDVSVELAIREFSYDAQKKLLVLNSIRFEGVTILGYREDGTKVNPGMTGSNIKIADLKKDADFSENETKQLLKKIESKLNELTTYSKGKEELIVNDQNQPVTVPVEPENTVPTEPENQPEQTVLDATPVEPTAEPEGVAVEPEGTEPEGGEPENVGSSPAQFSKTFELAHDDIRVAIYNLLSAYEEANNEWYYIEKVYDSYVIYSGESGLYKQEYTKSDNTVEFTGERIHMNAEYVTDDELAILNEMRKNYAGLVEKLAQYESEPEKLKLFKSKDYALIRENDDFKKLQEREVYFSLTVDELKTRCENLLNSEAKKLGQTFAANDNTAKIGFAAKPIIPNKPVVNHGRYGSMFVK